MKCPHCGKVIDIKSSVTVVKGKESPKPKKKEK